MIKSRVSLRSSEWVLTGSLFFLFFTIAAISKIKASKTNSERKAEIIMVDVSIEGHVKKPGIYSVAKGTPVQTVLKKAIPKKNADIQSLPFKENISHSCSINVPCLQELSIRIEGELQNPGLFHVAVGTRISDLKQLVLLTPDADKKYFKKRRQLEDGETLIIPQKKASGVIKLARKSDNSVPS